MRIMFYQLTSMCKASALILPIPSGKGGQSWTKRVIICVPAGLCIHPHCSGVTGELSWSCHQEYVAALLSGFESLRIQWLGHCQQRHQPTFHNTKDLLKTPIVDMMAKMNMNHLIQAYNCMKDHIKTILKAEAIFIE